MRIRIGDRAVRMYRIKGYYVEKGYKIGVQLSTAAPDGNLTYYAGNGRFCKGYFEARVTALKALTTGKVVPEC